MLPMTRTDAESSQLRPGMRRQVTGPSCRMRYQVKFVTTANSNSDHNLPSRNRSKPDRHCSAAPSKAVRIRCGSPRLLM